MSDAVSIWCVWCILALNLVSMCESRNYFTTSAGAAFRGRSISGDRLLLVLLPPSPLNLPSCWLPLALVASKIARSCHLTQPRHDPILLETLTIRPHFALHPVTLVPACMGVQQKETYVQNRGDHCRTSVARPPKFSAMTPPSKRPIDFEAAASPSFCPAATSSKG